MESEKVLLNMKMEKIEEDEDDYSFGSYSCNNLGVFKRKNVFIVLISEYMWQLDNRTG